jgi:hypothetical protein
MMTRSRSIQKHLETVRLPDVPAHEQRMSNSEWELS